MAGWLAAAMATPRNSNKTQKDRLSDNKSLPIKVKKKNITDKSSYRKNHICIYLHTYAHYNINNEIF